MFSQGDLSIEGSGELIATGGTAASAQLRRYIPTEKLTISGGELYIAWRYGRFKLWNFHKRSDSDLRMYGNRNGGTFSSRDATGIFSDAGGITINGAKTTVIATGGEANSSSNGADDIKTQWAFIRTAATSISEENAVVDANWGGERRCNDQLLRYPLNKSFQDGSGGTLTITDNADVTAGGIVVNMQNGFGGAACIVSGNAKVSIEAPDAMEGESSGLSMTNGYFMLSGEAAVPIHAGQGKYGSCGMIFGVDSESAGQNAGEKDGMFIMTGGTLEVKSSLARNSRAIVAKIGMEISGGTLVVQSDEASDGDSTGLFLRWGNQYKRHCGCHSGERYGNVHVCGGLCRRRHYAWRRARRFEPGRRLSERGWLVYRFG